MPAPLSISCGGVPDAVINVPYSHAFPATGGTPPYTFAILAGTLPAGLSLNTSTGVVSGTPTVSGSVLLTIQVTDSSGGGSSYPATIPANLSGYDFADSPYSSRLAFEYSGAQYAVLHQFGSDPIGDQGLHILRSLDQGNTWAEIDAAHAPSLPSVTGGGLGTYTVGVDGNAVILLWVRYHQFGGVFTYDGLTFDNFNLATGLWGIPVDVASSPALDAQNNAGLPYSAFPLVSINILVRGAGDYIVLYSGPREVVSGTSYPRAYYATWDGATFGAGTKLPGQTGVADWYIPNSAGVDSSGVCHFITQSGGVGAGDSLWHTGLSALNAFGIQANIANDLVGVDRYGAGDVSPVINIPGSPDRIALLTYGDIASPDGNVALYHATAALNPSWAASVVTTNTAYLQDATSTGSVFPAPQFLSLAYNNGNIFATWAGNQNVGGGHRTWAWYYAIAPVSTFVFGAPALLAPAPDFPDSTIPGEDTPAAQILVYPAGSGFGSILNWNNENDNEWAQFFGIGLSTHATATVICSLTVAQACFVDQFTKQAYTLADTIPLAPDTAVDYLVWGILEKIFSDDAELGDRQKSAYAGARYREGINAFRSVMIEMLDDQEVE